MLYILLVTFRLSEKLTVLNTSFKLVYSNCLDLFLMLRLPTLAIFLLIAWESAKTFNSSSGSFAVGEVLQQALSFSVKF